MATFEAQVSGLTSLTIDDSSSPTRAELNQFLTDGAKEIINIMPSNLLPLCSSQSTFTSTAVGSEAETLNTGKILNVFRNDGDIDQPCRIIDSTIKGRVSDPYEMQYATVTDPVFYVENNKINALPDGGSCKYSEVQYPTVSYTHEDISVFPDEAEYLVPLYASIKSLQNALGNKTSDLPSDISFASIPVGPAAPSFNTGAISLSSSAPTYTKPVFIAPTLSTVGSLILPPSPTAPTISAKSVEITGTAPKYTKPVLLSQTSFNNYWTLGDFGDNDPGDLSITAGLSGSPTLTSVTFTSIDSALDTVTPLYTTATVGASSTYTGSAPAFTKPTVALSLGQVASYIDSKEDLELASSKLQQVNSELSEYQANISNEQAEFNKENVAYQSAIQESMQEVQIANQVNLAKAQADLQVATSNKERDQQRQLQNGINDMQAIINDNNRKISLYQAEVQAYQANVSKEVQEYTQKLSRYQLELNTVYTAWAKTESDNMAKYQSDIQNELNEFNKENIEYQSKLQKDIQDAQLSDANEARKLQKFQSELSSYQSEINAEIQKWINEEWSQNFQKYQQDYGNKLQEYNSDLQNELNEFNKEQTVFQNELQEKIQEANNQQTKDSAEYSAKIQKYANEIQVYTTEVNIKVQDFNTKLQKHSTDYQWLQGQHKQLIDDYNRGVQILTGGGQPQRGK